MVAGDFMELRKWIWKGCRWVGKVAGDLERLPVIWKGWRWFGKVDGDLERLPVIWKGCRWFGKVDGDLERLPVIEKGCRCMIWKGCRWVGKVAGDWEGLPVIDKCYRWFGNGCRWLLRRVVVDGLAVMVKVCRWWVGVDLIRIRISVVKPFIIFIGSRPYTSV